MNITDFKQTDFYKNSDFKNGFDTEVLEIEKWMYLASRFDNWKTNTTVNSPIPHIIHQVWIGSEFPEKYREWANSWTKINKNWEYKLWTEDNLLPLMNDQQKKWYFKTSSFGPKSDLARFLVLSKFGGIYCDTDFECLKSFDDFCNTTTLFAGTIFNSKPEIAGGIVGAVPHHPLIEKTLELLTSNDITTSKTLDILEGTGPAFFTRCIFDNTTLLNSSDVFLPTHYLYPFPNYENNPELTLQKIKKEFIKPNSMAIHYWDQSWMKFDSKLLKMIKKIIKAVIFYDKWK